jgi:hypothetical protein
MEVNLCDCAGCSILLGKLILEANASSSKAEYIKNLKNALKSPVLPTPNLIALKYEIMLVWNTGERISEQKKQTLHSWISKYVRDELADRARAVDAVKPLKM